MLSILTFILRGIWEAYLEPLLTFFGLYKVNDLSYGRSRIPFSAMEERLHSNPDVHVWFGKVMLENGKDWVWYQVWEPMEPTCSPRPDVLFVHGTGVHSGTFASHSRRYLDAGFRLIVPDLPSHGYSSGLHVYRRKLGEYTAGLRAVLHDVASRDDKIHGLRSKVQRQQTFLLGLSFGGTVALHYGLDYPHSIRSDPTDPEEIAIDGICVVGPILGYSPTNVTFPPYLVKLANFCETYLGLSRFELMVPHKKSLDKDPKVYKSLINEDKRSHQGAFRLGHLKCINDAVSRLQREAGNFNHPVLIQQGGQDRVACPIKSIRWVRSINSADKRMAIYPVCQHVIFRKAKTEEEDQAGRVACIGDSVEWMGHRVDWPRSTDLITFNSPFDAQGRFTPPQTPSSSVSSSLVSSRNTSYSSSGHSTPTSPYEPDMTELTPSHFPGTPQEQEDQDAYSSDGKLDTETPAFGRLPFLRHQEDKEEPHPLLASPHKTTLPALARLCPERSYKIRWALAPILRPYDILVYKSAADLGSAGSFSS